MLTRGYYFYDSSSNKDNVAASPPICQSANRAPRELFQALWAPQRFHEALSLEGIHTSTEGADPRKDQPLGTEDVLRALHEVHLHIQPKAKRKLKWEGKHAI